MSKELLFLGTGAAELLPSPFCTCPLCVNARVSAKDQRLRSMFLVDNETMIDFGPDLGAACMRHDIDLTHLKRVFVTHTHEDHFDTSNFGLLRMSRTRSKEPIDIYLSEAAYDATCKKYAALAEGFSHIDAVVSMAKGLARLHPLKTFETADIDGYSVLPVRTTHRVSDTETAVNYLITSKNGKKLLYASDTGLYPEDTLEALRGAAIDLLVMEGTFGSNQNANPASHLMAHTFVEMLRMMEKYGVLRADTAVYLTHINHKHDFTHDMYQTWMDENAKRPVTIAYDGLCISKDL